MGADGGSPTAPFLFDTNIIIDFGEDLYVPDVFIGLWSSLEVALGEGKIVVCRVVLQELKKKQKPPAWHSIIHNACNKHAVDESRPAVQIVFKRLSADIAAKRLSRKLSDNDLFILACAEVDGLPLVTRDTKMRDACDNGFVKSTTLSVVDLFRHFGWQF